jgi:hypothetical protein
MPVRLTDVPQTGDLADLCGSWASRGRANEFGGWRRFFAVNPWQSPPCQRKLPSAPVRARSSPRQKRATSDHRARRAPRAHRSSRPRRQLGDRCCGSGPRRARNIRRGIADGAQPAGRAEPHEPGDLVGETCWRLIARAPMPAPSASAAIRWRRIGAGREAEHRRRAR